MEIKTLTNRFGPATAAVAILVLPAAATAEPVVPPENSAATQYTEAIPTGGGQKEAGGQSGHGAKHSPAQVLGSHNARKLNAQGPQGKAAAEVAAATAPSIASTPQPEPSSKQAGGGSSAKHGEGGNRKHRAGQATPTPQADGGSSLAEGSSGSSGLGEVLAQATGSSSSGQLGGLLPLLIVSTILWSLIYLRRRRPE